MWRLVDNGAARPGVGVDLGLVEGGTRRGGAAHSDSSPSAVLSSLQQ